MSTSWTLAFIAAVGLLASGAAGVADTATPPGTLLATEPMPGAPAGARAWRIHYTSRSDSGKPEVVTGVVIAPTTAAPLGGRPVVAWAHGTVGVEPPCAPSLSPAFFKITPGLEDEIARGYVVVATDYPGLGTPQPHPYLVGASEAHAVLDGVRAARALTAAGASNRFAVWGESQGGHAALFTGELARDYAPDLRLVGVAASAPSTDLIANLSGGKDPAIRAFLTAYAAHSWSRHFGAPLSSVGGPVTRRVIGKIAKTCVILDTKPKLGVIVGIMLLRRTLGGVDLGRIEPWRTIARENSTGSRPPGAPLFIAQNPSDVIVAPAVTQAFARRVCARGGAMRYVVLNGKGHETSGADSAKAALDWIAARFADEPAPSDCATI